MSSKWACEVRRQCHEENVPFFFKQWGGTNKKKTGRILDGKLYSEMPLMGVEKTVLVNA
jgi:protein gp37